MSYSLAFLGVLPLEPFNATGGVHQLLLTSKERMAFRTDFQVNLRLRRARFERFSARAPDDSVNVVGMDIGFHYDPPTIPQVIIRIKPILTSSSGCNACRN